MSSDLARLFDLDPLLMTQEDIATIIKRMREAQTQYDLGVRAPVAERKTKSKQTKDLLKDLGLG